MRVLSVNGQEYVVSASSIAYFGLVRRRRFLFFRQWRMQITLLNGQRLYVQNDYEEVLEKYSRRIANGVERMSFGGVTV